MSRGPYLDEDGVRHAGKVVMVQQECRHLAHRRLANPDARFQPWVAQRAPDESLQASATPVTSTHVQYDCVLSL